MSRPHVDPKDCKHADDSLTYVGEWNEIEHAPSSHLCTRCKTSVQRESPVGGQARRPFTPRMQMTNDAATRSQ